MITLGVILIILGVVLNVSILYSLGVLLLVIGLVLWFIPSISRGRRWY